MMRYFVVIGLAAAIGSAAGPGVAPASAQTHPLQPSRQGVGQLEKSAGVIEGTLTRVDGRSETVDVSVGFLGLLGKTLEVDRDTLIQVNGRDARFADLQEGAKVKAFYRERGAKLVATRIEASTGG
jgi:hypothetical protein